MKIAKVLVLTIFLAVTGYAAVVSQVTSADDHGKAAACKTDCCKAAAECCKSGAECCKAGAECCKTGAECCASGAACCGAGMTCGANDKHDSQSAGCCAAAKNGEKKNDDKATAKSGATNCCGSGCSVHASSKK